MLSICHHGMIKHKSSLNRVYDKKILGEKKPYWGSLGYERIILNYLFKHPYKLSHYNLKRTEQFKTGL